MKSETDWAIRNLELAGLLSKESDYDGAIGEAVKELLLVLQKQGHSGASHAQTIIVFNKVAAGKSLTLEHWNERFKAFNEFSKRVIYTAGFKDGFGQGLLKGKVSFKTLNMIPDKYGGEYISVNVYLPTEDYL